MLYLVELYRPNVYTHTHCIALPYIYNYIVIDNLYISCNFPTVMLEIWQGSEVSISFIFGLQWMDSVILV